MSQLKQRFLEQELQVYVETLAKAADTVIDEGVSKYPIFIAHQAIVDAGIPIIDREKTKGNWNIHLSSLEEFATKKLIEMEKVDEFRKVYKEHDEHVCFFVLSELGATFNFLPKKGK